MNTTLLLPPDSPPAGRLGLLTAVVLVLHLALLTDWSGWQDGFRSAGRDPAQAPMDTPAAGTDAAASPGDTQATPASHRSTVRWLLVPPPPPPPAPAPPPRPVPSARAPAPAIATPPPPAPERPAEPLTPDVVVPTETAATPEPAADAAAEAPPVQAQETAPPPSVPVAAAAPAPAPAPAPDHPPPPPVLAQATTVPAFRTQGLPPAIPPPGAQLEYDVTGQSKGMNYQASGTLDWWHDGQTFQAQMKVSAFLLGSRTQRSSGRIDGTGLHPERFVDISRRERETRLDNQTGLISYHGHAHQDPLQPGAQDRLSVMLQLAARFNASSPTEGQRINLQVAGPSGTERWAFEVLAKTVVQVPAGAFPAWPVQRVARDGDRMTVWLAPELSHLPVRLVLLQAQGDRLEQALSQRP
ncbi:MAG: DUF3108 domain-containing protein [Burkholderiaceae bacterium]